MRQTMTAAALAVAALAAHGAETTVSLNAVDPGGIGAAAGSVRIAETPHGLVFTPDLTGIAPGLHGFHVHENAACGPAPVQGKIEAGGAAGGHLDPANSGRHAEPWGSGHLGDLPPLFVAADGTAKNPVLAPRLKLLSELRDRALMVHAGGDNHADHPQPLGGGGARVACGVVR